MILSGLLTKWSSKKIVPGAVQYFPQHPQLDHCGLYAALYSLNRLPTAFPLIMKPSQGFPPLTHLPQAGTGTEFEKSC
jgi:hypothetical protein